MNISQDAEFGSHESAGCKTVIFSKHFSICGEVLVLYLGRWNQEKEFEFRSGLICLLHVNIFGKGINYIHPSFISLPDILTKGLVIGIPQRLMEKRLLSPLHPVVRKVKSGHTYCQP